MHITTSRILISFVFIVICFSLSLLFVNSAEETNNHFVKTLRDKEHRIELYFEVDRGYYFASTRDNEFITTFNEKLRDNNLNLTTSETMSIKD